MLSLKAKLPIWIFIVVAAFGIAVIILLIQYKSSVFDEIRLQSLENAYWTKIIPQKDILANWKAYRNYGYGFEVKYPVFNPKDRIQIEQHNLGIIIDFQNWLEKYKVFLTNFSFFIMDNPQKLSLQKWFAKNIDDNNSTLINKGVYRIITLPDGIETLQMQDVPIPSEFLDEYGPLTTSAYMAPKSNEFIIGFAINGQENSLDSYGFGGSDGYDRLTNQILSTFKFIEPIDISNWKTYRNYEYGFEMKYPNNWKSETRRDNSVDMIGPADSLLPFVLPKNPADMTGTCKVSIRRSDNPDNLSLSSWLKQAEEETGAPPPISSVPITIDGVTGIKEVIEEIALVTTVYLPKGDKIIAIVLFCGDDVFDKCNILFDQILSTFKFIP